MAAACAEQTLRRVARQVLKRQPVDSSLRRLTRGGDHSYRSVMNRRVALAALAALSLTACGSRADFNVVQGSGSGDGSVVGTGTTGGGSTGAVGTGGTTSGGTAVGGAGTTGGSGSTATGGTSTGGTTGGATGGTTGATSGATTGVVAAGGAPIRLAYIIQGSAGVSALTGSQVSGDSDVAARTMNALVAYANAHGGVGGRKISAVGQKSEATSQQSDRLALCKHITEDLKAQVLIDANQYLSEEGWACFAQHKTDYLGTVTATDRSFLKRYGPYLATTWMTEDRSMKAAAIGGNAVGFYKGQKVGVLLSDVPTSHRLADTVLKPELAKVGATNVTYRYITNDSGGGQQAQTNSAVLAFQQAGVKRILFFHNILVYLGFTNQAQSQGYKPNYLFTDYQGMTGVAAFYGATGSGHAQNADAVGISSSASFVPDDASQKSTDTSAAYNRSKMTPGQRNCLDILSKQTGKNYYDPTASGDSLGTWSYYCDEFFAWWAAAKAVGSSWAPGDFGKGLAALGRSYQSTIQNSTSWSPGVYDGASTFRAGTYNGDCSCFVKATGWLPI
jgi:hypothetical protein